MEHEELATTTTTTSSSSSSLSSSSSTSTSTSTPTSQAQVLRIALSIIEKAPRKRHSIASSPKQLWTIQEDTLLVEAVKKHGLEAWPSVAEKLPGRVAKQCRDRYRNHLCPKVKKGSWTAEEDAILFQYQKIYGNLWAEIAKHLPGRTDLSVKNRFYSKARKYDRHLKRLARESPVIRAAKQTPQSQPPSPQIPASTMRSPEFAACNLADRANKKRKIEPSAKMAILSALQHASSVVPKHEPAQTAPTSSMLLGTPTPSPLTLAPHASPTSIFPSMALPDLLQIHQMRERQLRWQHMQHMQRYRHLQHTQESIVLSTSASLFPELPCAAKQPMSVPVHGNTNNGAIISRPEDGALLLMQLSRSGNASSTCDAST